MAKLINKSNPYRILIELNQNSTDLNLICLLNELPSQDSDLICLLYEYLF